MRKKKKVIITITEGKGGVAVRIQCLPTVREAGICAAWGRKAFRPL